MVLVRGGRRVVAGAVVALAACSGVVACSGSGGAAGSSASASPSVVVSGSASATAEASASASVLGEVTAESLSDEELGYIVTSIPEGLTSAQEEVLVAFAVYDRFTWSLWFSPAQPGVGTAGAEEYITADYLPTLQENYDVQEPGDYRTGSVRVAVLSVDVQDTYMPATADMVICMDRTEIRRYNAAGEETSGVGSQGRTEYRVTMSTIEGTWKADDEVVLSMNECVV